MSLTPDYMFHTYDEITPQFLKRIGFVVAIEM